MMTSHRAMRDHAEDPVGTIMSKDFRPPLQRPVSWWNLGVFVAAVTAYAVALSLAA